MVNIQAQLEKFLTDKAGETVSFDLPNDISHGDLTSNIAFVLAAKQKKAPREIAVTLALEINKQPELKEIVEATVAGAGYINISYNPEVLIELVAEQSQIPLTEPISNTLKNEKILIDYSAPNIAKPMHFGHLRSTIIGESLKRIMAALGAEALGINHLGDWGNQFGKVLAAYKRWGSPELLVKGSIDDLLKLYVKFHDQLDSDPALAEEGAREFVLLESGDQTSRRIWKRMREISLPEFHRIYQRLNITLDEPDLGESFYEPMLAELIKMAETSGVAKESEGALVIPMGDDLPPCLIRKSNGATLYVTRDLAALNYRVEKWHPSKILYVVAAEQSLHFTQLFRAAKLLKIASGVELAHVPFGLVRLPGGKLSTRAGRVVLLSEVMDEAIKRSLALLREKGSELPRAEQEEIAESIGLGALKYQDLRCYRQTSVTFDWDKMLTLKGNTGPYIQYTAARASSVLAKANTNISAANLTMGDNQEQKILRLINRLPRIIQKSAADLAPNHIADWLYNLSSEFNRFYENHPILTAPSADLNRRLVLTAWTRRGLERGLNLLGINAPEKL